MAFKNITPLIPNEVMEGFLGKFVHGKSMTASFWEIKKGSILPRHSHIHEQISIITEGRFEMIIGSEKMVMKPGTVGVIPSNTEHEGVALTDCRIIDFFCPSREEYQND